MPDEEIDEVDVESIPLESGVGTTVRSRLLGAVLVAETIA